MTTGTIVYVVSDDESGQRLDLVTAFRGEVTRSQVKKLIDDGRVVVESSQSRQLNISVRTNTKVRPGDRIILSLPSSGDEELIPEQMELNILFEDDHIIFVNKPAGLVVYPAVGHSRGTLMNALRYHCSVLASIGGPFRPGVIHRLDKDTSGVMVVAKTDSAYYHLQNQFKERTINRRYLALIYGSMKGVSGAIEAAIGRSDNDRKKMSTRTRRGKEAVTLWKTLEIFTGASLIEAKLKTGRTHQIRVHFSSVGHPVLGDRVYGRKIKIGENPVPRQMLHAESLGIIHPHSGEWFEFSIPPPQDMAYLLDVLRTRS